MQDLEQLLGREPSAMDQLPGTYRYKTGRKCPWQPVRLMRTDDGMWHCLLRGEPVTGSPRHDPQNIPFVYYFSPFHPISELEYAALIDEYRAAKIGSPLLRPDEPVNLRRAKPV